ncbi:long-chain fatty acid transport protein 4-like [Leptidea sinapis]|uniref:long-chain fatty acid transport protein 4-like n=1 Tax=Leptidea sinapis TaxID=189913 RepID=UPI0021331E82|nr:long-chain fatty acid transport protein 4-like [Leptidea sinapis]
MSEGEGNLDRNMNMTEVKNGKLEIVYPSKDVEQGKRANESSNTPWGRIIAMVIAIAVLVAACAVTWVLISWQIGLIVAAALIVLYVIVFCWKRICIIIKTVPRDLSAVYCYIKILLLARKYTKLDYMIPDILHDVVKRHPNKACFLFEDEVWTFQQVEDFSLRVSAVLKAQGVKRGDIVAVMASNYPEMPSMWAGITRLGAIAPLINTNQTGNTLLHSINIAKCDYFIYGSEFDDVVQDIRKDLNPSLKVLKFTRRPLNTSNDNVRVVESEADFTSLLETTTPLPWTKSDGEGFNGKMLYIYTSGTTGLPKAAVISTLRMCFMASGVHYLGSLRKSDVIYCPMPLYHSAGGVITVGQAFIFGCTVALRTKFSASAYFPDCIKYKATAAHYIGEMCRYVLATKPSETDRQHTVRTVYGNGMRLTVWNDFVKRFGIKKVVEFYGATEGNANIVNIDNKPGAIGFISRIIPAIYPIAIIKVDEDTGEPIRNSKGLCQLAKPYEAGVFIGKIQPNHPSRAFLGYVDKEASEKKIVRNVLKHGDSAFISGDILTSDDLGYLYFRDRTGDTFRWRGENVSTTEVEATISRIANQRDAVVYGVEIPNTEGRAGMCGIVDADDTLDLDKLALDMAKDLPKYARPVFIRIMKTMDMTATFKIRKVDLQKEGYNPSTIADKLYYFDPKQNKYVILGSEDYDKIVSGQIRL